MADVQVVLAALVPATGDEDQPRLDALRRMVEEAGGIVVATVVQRRGVSRARRPGGTNLMRRRVALNHGTLLGRGKVAELVETVRSSGAGMVLFLNSLTDRQKLRLEQATGVTVQACLPPLMTQATETG